MNKIITCAGEYTVKRFNPKKELRVRQCSLMTSWKAAGECEIFDVELAVNVLGKSLGQLFHGMNWMRRWMQI
jgi:hypothetical protein